MKLDLYIKFILTVIAIGVFIPMLANQPMTYKANAFENIDGMITNHNKYIYHLKGHKIRACIVSEDLTTTCGNWSK